ncbi:oxidoreductase [Helicobacter pylori]|nr:oxidoreductase [Helicobacter pylori]OPG27061.1 oxidoreductase [Helicobacter pylori]
MFKGILVFLIPIVLIGLVLTAIRATIMAFRGDTDDFFSRIWDKFVEYFGYILVTIIMFFPYIIGPVIVIIFILI